MSKFMRNYLIKCIMENDTTVLIGDTNFEQKEGWEYPQLLTAYFDIKRDTFASSNEAHIQIYNLSQSNRQLLFHDKFACSTFDLIEVYAGYGQDLSLIFRGRILEAYSFKQNCDMITDIHAIDLAFLQYQKNGKQVNHTNTTLAEGTSVKDAINQVGGDTDGSVGAVGSIGDKQIQTPITLLGNSIAVISEVTGGHVFVDLGKINVLSNKECIKVGQIPVINADSGLLGTPMRRDVQLEVDILFDPTLIVGQAIDLQTSTGVSEYSGIWKIIGIHHSGVISSATCGAMKTRLNLLTGLLTPQTNLALVDQPSEDITEVHNDERNKIDVDVPSDVQDVYRYIQKNNKAPHKFIPDTRIRWNEAVRDKNLAHGVKPTLTHLANVYGIARALTSEVRKKYGNVVIGIESGWRDKSNNRTVGGSSTSLHLEGKALDVTKIGNLKRTEIVQFFDSLNWTNKEVLVETSCIHIGYQRTRGTSYGFYLGNVWAKRKRYQTKRDK